MYVKRKKGTAKRLNSLTQLIFDCSTQKAAINVEMLAITCKKTAKSTNWKRLKKIEKKETKRREREKLPYNLIKQFTKCFNAKIICDKLRTG